MKKKMMSLLIVASLCLSMTTVAFAADNAADTDSAETSEDAVQEETAEDAVQGEIPEIAENYGIAMLASNTMSGAGSMKEGTWYSGSLDSYQESEYWTFTIPTSGRVTMYIETAASAVSIYTLQADGSSAGGHVNATGGSSSNMSSVSQSKDLVSGQYYYRVYLCTGSSTGSYRIKYSFTSANESIKESQTSNNNTAAKASSISLNTTYNGQIAENDSIDYYKFTVSSAQEVLLSIDSNDRLTYGIYKSTDLDHSVWYSRNLTGSTRKTFSLDAGSYYFVVSEYHTGNYSFSLGKNLNGVCKADDGNWYNYKDGVVQKGVTVAKNSNGWWYINKNGKVDFSYTGFASNSNGKWYCEKGKVKFSKNSVIKDTTGAIGTKGTWYYVTGSKVQTGFTGLANYKNSNGWWYIKKGKVDFSHNGVDKNKNGWYYVTGGKVNFNYTGVANYKNSNGWWYIKKGKVDFTYTGRAKNKNGTWNVVNGKVRF